MLTATSHRARSGGLCDKQYVAQCPFERSKEAERHKNDLLLFALSMILNYNLLIHDFKLVDAL